MFNPTGNIMFNGLSDGDIVKLFEMKIRHESDLTINPQQMQPTQAQTPRGPEQVYNNVTLGWRGEGGLDAAKHAIESLLRKEETKAQGQ